MGQYHYPVNFDKREFINPHKFNDGIKLLEFGTSGEGTMFGLAVLLAASNTPEARGGGDLHPWIDGHGSYGDGRAVEGDPERADWLMRNVVGRWAGDRIAIIGDYAEDTDAQGLVGTEGSPWSDDPTWDDISSDVVEAIELDYYVHERRKAVAR